MELVGAADKFIADKNHGNGHMPGFLFEFIAEFGIIRNIDFFEGNVFIFEEVFHARAIRAVFGGVNGNGPAVTLFASRLQGFFG